MIGISTIFFLETLAYASTLALLSLGLSLTYTTTRVPNFAHATIASIGTYVLLTVVGLMRLRGLNIYLYSIPAAFITVGIITLLQYVLVLKPLADRGNGLIGLMISTLALDIILMGVINIYADFLLQTFKAKKVKLQVRDQPALRSYDARIELFGQNVNVSGLVAFATLIAVAILLWLLLNKTKTGIAMRAAIENPALAEVLGVNVNRMYMLAWFLAGGLAGVGGVFMGMVQKISPAMGALLIVSVFAGSIAGGITSVFGSMLGGLLVGFAENFGPYYSSLLLNMDMTGYDKMFSLGIIVVVLLLVPGGLASLDLSGLKKRLPLLRAGGVEVSGE